MSANPSAATPGANSPGSPSPWPAPTPDDHEAMFWSVVWFREKESQGQDEKYCGKHVALLGEKVLDLDTDQAELIRRVEALGDTIRQSRVVLQYVPTYEESRIH